jgi:hypothetical protein
VLDACDAASEKTEDVEEEAEEERVAAYGWVSGKKPKFWGKISMLMLKGRVTIGKVADEMQTIRSERRGDCGLLSRL